MRQLIQINGAVQVPTTTEAGKTWGQAHDQIHGPGLSNAQATPSSTTNIKHWETHVLLLDIGQTALSSRIFPALAYLILRGVAFFMLWTQHQLVSQMTARRYWLVLN